jgi:hypothetical protein
MRLVQVAAERPAGNGGDVGLVASVTPPAELTPARGPDGYQRMDSGACFRNAFTLATSSSSLLYGEGYAFLPHSEGQGAWIHHAWVIDPGYRAVDVTWREPGARYVGIAVSPSELGSRQLRKQQPRLVEPVLATMAPVVRDLAQVTWDLAGWFAGTPGPARHPVPRGGVGGLRRPGPQAGHPSPTTTPT